MTDSTPPETVSTPVRAGVVGVGAMGENHARVYSELNGVELVGVSDLDTDLAERVADEYDTTADSLEGLLETADVVTVAVPTAAHYDTVRTCLDAGVHVLVEKPIADAVDRAEELERYARERGLTLQVGHVERFNPAVQTLLDIVEELDVLAVEAERLGPPVDRMLGDGVVRDLMIHDVDVVRALLGDDPDSVAATQTADGQHATAVLEYDGVVANLTASRVTQKKIRTLTVTAEQCLVEVDYLDQRVLIHRKSYPEYVTDDGTNRYRHEGVVERPRVENHEPLKRELESFVSAATNGHAPEVTAEDGTKALETIRAIERAASEERVAEPEVRAR